MKIKVIHTNGTVETLSLGEGSRFEPGQNGCCRIVDGNTDHFFQETGHYDGWGMSMPNGVSEAEASVIIEAVESAREK